ncbi:hypothetical protein PGH24_01075 [Thermoanaerobacterium thermosaccharolyticum]|uniref:hypothetical protein n=1 Tax=Thermoanaerobacterium thermosaccharolyticum TaxID=1517 RepID=UPI0027982A4F|nr:hypothetical protein [Thermoanaerobacterium sp.]WHE07387.1 hypothetical protein PGH24_01075 [Thermoanaerobacterium thermosaccharolyticum]
MKKVLIFVVIVMLILISTFPAFAATPINTLVQQQLDLAKEKDQVEGAISDSQSNPKKFLVDNKHELGRKELMDVSNPDDLIYGKAYKVYIANKEVVQDLIEGKNISNALLNAPYEWEVPVKFNNKSVASITVSFLDNRWNVGEIGGYLSPDSIDFVSNPDGITSYLDNNNLKEAKTFIHFRVPSLHSDFLYIEANSGEYFIPIIHGEGKSELYGLKDKKIYTKDEIISAIGPTLKAGLNDTGMTTGRPSINGKDLGNQVYYLITLIIFIAFITIFYFVKSKRKYSYK